MCNKVGASESSKDVLIKQQLAFFSEEKERKEKTLCLAASHLRHVHIKGPVFCQILYLSVSLQPSVMSQGELIPGPCFVSPSEKPSWPHLNVGSRSSKA